MILVGHNITEMKKLPAQSVHCVVTSPPYWGLRAYGTDPQVWGDGWSGELGSEPTPGMFVSHMVEVFAEVWRVLRDDGTCWVNLGDSYATGGGAVGRAPGGGDQGERFLRAGMINTQPNRMPIPGLKSKELVGIPWRVAFALQEYGFYLRQDIIWHKPNPMPESVQDRCTKAHEYLFLLTKSERYYFDAEAIRVPAKYGRCGWNGNAYGRSREAMPGDGRENSAGSHMAGCDPAAGANRRSVWSISTHSYKGAHFATFPPRLVEPCILAGTSAAGCCPTCGAPWRRMVESKRVATRPGTDTKVPGKNSRMFQERDPQHGGEYKADRHALEVGNRDPQRHVSVKVTTGWQQSCKCEPAEAVPCTVLDPFGGSGTTAIVAEYHGRKSILCELNESYAELARARIAEGWQPPKPKSGKKRRKKTKEQRELFAQEQA